MERNKTLKRASQAPKSKIALLLKYSIVGLKR